MKTDPSQIELSPEHRASLAQLAEKTGKPWPEVLSEALRSYRPANGVGNTQGTSKSFYDVMNVDGVIGIVKDAPADLSTNPRHMEGFGRGRDCNLVGSNSCPSTQAT